MTQKTRHATGRVVFSQTVGRQNVGKSRVTRRREPIFLPREPALRWIGVARIKLIRDWRLERLVMSGERSVLQTFWYVNPAQAVFMQNERRITRNCIEAFGAYLRLEVGRFSFHKAGNVYAGPFFRVPPHQFFPFAPWMSIRPRTGAVIYDASIARPCEAPAMTEIIFGFA